MIKIKFLLAPALSTAVVGTVLHHQNTVLAEVQLTTEKLQNRINQSRGSLKSNLIMGPPETIFYPEGIINRDLVKSLVSSANKPSRSGPNMASLFSMLENATRKELVSFWNHIEDLEAGQILKQRLEYAVMLSLASKDPAKALSLTEETITSADHHLSSLQRKAFSCLAQRDSEAATHWLDQQMIEGNLENTSLFSKTTPACSSKPSL